MTVEDFSQQFDILYNNITSNQAPGLNEYEKSVFLTKAQDELVKNYFEPRSKGNTLSLGFDDSIIRQMDFSSLIRNDSYEALSVEPSIDRRAKVYRFPDEAFVLLNEQIYLYDNTTSTTETLYYKFSKGSWSPYELPKGKAIEISGTRDAAEFLPDNEKEGAVYKVVISKDKLTAKNVRQVVPLSYEEYTRLMNRPYKEPLKTQAWRLFSLNRDTANTTSPETTVEIVIPYQDVLKYVKYDYVVRYVVKPEPIILVNLHDEFDEDVSIENKFKPSGCMLGENAHQAVLQRAVELAKVAWGDDANQTQLTMNAGNRSE